jgi:YD repeat-containing protein
MKVGALRPARHQPFNADSSCNGGAVHTCPLFKTRLRDASLINLTYDALNRLTLRDTPGATPDVTYTYDNLGRMLGASQQGHAETFTFDALSRITTATGPLGAMTYGYNLAGRRTSMNYPAGQGALNITYVRDVLGRVTEVRDVTSGGIIALAQIAYDVQGRRKSLTYDNNVKTDYSYDAISNLTGLTLSGAGATANETRAFGYNPAGEQISLTGANPAYQFTPPTGTTTYAANGLNQYDTVGNGDIEH